MLAAAAVAAALAAFTPVVVHDASERFPLASAAAVAPVSRDAADRCARRVRPGRRPTGAAACGCSTGSFTATRTRTAGSSAPAATQATGSSSSTGSPRPAAGSRRSTRSTRGPSAAVSARSRSAAATRSSSPPTAPTRPICKRAPATGCGPTPTTRPTAAVGRFAPAGADHRARPGLDALSVALGRLAREPVSPRARLPSRSGVPAGSLGRRRPSPPPPARATPLQ